MSEQFPGQTPDAEPEPETQPEAPEIEESILRDPRRPLPHGVAHDPADDSPWHRVHVPHLVMGLAFLGLVVVWLVVVPLDAVELPHARWLFPLPWLVAGAAGLAATVLSGRRRRP